MEKLADLKLKGPAVDTLLAIAEAVGPTFVATHVHKKAAAHKNPKVGASQGGAVAGARARDQRGAPDWGGARRRWGRGSRAYPGSRTCPIMAFAPCIRPMRPARAPHPPPRC